MAVRPEREARLFQGQKGSLQIFILKLFVTWNGSLCFFFSFSILSLVLFLFPGDCLEWGLGWGKGEREGEGP